MARKRRQYQIKNYTMWDFDDAGIATKEGQEINIAENQVIELIQAIKGCKYNEDGINPIPELIFLEVNNKTNRDQLTERIKNGLIVDDYKYNRLIRSSSMARSGTISFVDENIKDELMKLISLGKLEIIDKAVISKLESYLGLAFSTTIFIDVVPENVCIVDADIFKVTIEDYVKTVKDNKVVQGLYDVDVELFDGQGLHTPTWGKKVASALELDNRPTGLQIRLLPAFKGMSYEIDFKKFYKEKGIEYIEDYKGKKWKVEDLDCIWTTSMFKFNKYFDGWDEVKELREKYYTPLGQNKIGISKWSISDDNSNKKTRMTYQYLQSLALTSEDLVDMSQYTKDLVEKVYKGDIGATMIFLGLLNDISYTDVDGNEIDIFEENMMSTKVHHAIYKNPEMIKDPYIQSFLQRQLKRTIDDMKLGRIYVDGQYSFIAQDPILMLEMIAGIEPKGCLNKGEYYSTGARDYYTTFRSPLIHSSEVGKLNFVHNEITEKWLSRYKNIIVLNGKDITAQKHGGADFDGDTFFWTKDEVIVNAVIEKFENGVPNYPVVDIFESENRAEAVKEEYSINNIIKYDIRTLENRIGQITNIGTYFTTKGAGNKIFEGNGVFDYDKELVITRLMQGEEIDFVKHGIRTLEAPKEFGDAKKYKPYFLQVYKYKRDKNIQPNVATAPLNRLCKNIEVWEERLFKQESIKEIDTSDILRDKEILNKDREETLRVLEQLKPIYEDFKKESSRLYLKYNNRSEKSRRKAYDVFYDKYHAKVNAITNNKELLSSLAVWLNYIEDKKNKKDGSYSFPWICTWEGLSITIENKAPAIVQAPRLLTRQELNSLPKADVVNEFKGKFYEMVDITNKASAFDFIEKQYNKKIEKELKQQLSKFELETVLYGFKPRSTEDVLQIIENGNLRLGSKEYNGKQFAAIFADDEYIAGIKDKTEEILDDELGYIDLKTMRNKVDVEVIEKFNSSLKVKLKLVS